MVTASPDDTFERMIEFEATSFTKIFNAIYQISNISESILLWTGVFGNFSALVTMCTSKHMRTVSFAYHKCLTVAYLIYCLNFLTVKYLEKLRIVEQIPFPAFDNYYLAYYVGIISRVISSSAGFLAMYATLAISVDRFLAIFAFSRYSAFNRICVASVWIICSLILSVAFNSWPPWFEKCVVLRAIAPNKESNETGTITAYSIVRNEIDENILTAIRVKNLCNALVRCIYLLVLLALTSAILQRFFRQRQRRSSMTRENTQRRRRDHSLYFLMIAVLVLAYVQIVPREIKRAFEFLYPELYVESQIENEKLSIDQRRFYVRLYFYVYVMSPQVTNLCTAVEKSLFFYLNVILNYNFRQEFVALLRRMLGKDNDDHLQMAREISAGCYNVIPLSRIRAN